MTLHLLGGHQSMRDVWNQTNHGVVPAVFTATVPSHDVVLLRVRTATP